MEKETLKNIFYFLEEKEAHKTPFLWKWLNNEPLTEEDLNIKGDLDLSETEIQSLPEGLRVDGELNLSYSEIETLPKGLIVNSHLVLEESNIRSLPEGLKVGGDLILASCQYIFSLPKGLKVVGDLYLEGSGVLSLPKGLEVGGYLYINSTVLASKSDDELREMIKPGFIKGNIINDEADEYE